VELRATEELLGCPNTSKLHIPPSPDPRQATKKEKINVEAAHNRHYLFCCTDESQTWTPRLTLSLSSRGSGFPSTNHHVDEIEFSTRSAFVTLPARLGGATNSPRQTQAVSTGPVEAKSFPYKSPQTWTWPRSIEKIRQRSLRLISSSTCIWNGYAHLGITQLQQQPTQTT